MIFTIFKKELKDTLRDRRTLIIMLVIPLLLFPIILNVFVAISNSFQEEAATKTVKIGFIGSEDNYVKKQLEDLPEIYGDKEIVMYSDTTEMKEDLKKDTLQFALFVPSDFAKYQKDLKPAPVTVF